MLRVTDATGNFQLRGKQSKRPHGIWYTSVSGIWQTVWLERVPRHYIKSLQIQSSIDPPSLRLVVCADVEQLRVAVHFKERKVLEVEGKADGIEFQVPDAQLWSPESPSLYDLTIQLLEQGKVLDEVQSYAGIRSVGKKQDDDKHWRMTLNDQICFHLGPLDQGWWPDGLLTPPSDEAMRSDIEFLKRSGFNMIRKHVKVESRRYYHRCDELGIMVWQDHVSGTEKEGDCFKVPPWTRLEPNAIEAQWPHWAKTQFLSEFTDMVDTLYNSPAVVLWVPFNEAWGQHDTVGVAHWLQSYDPTRLVNVASGGNFFEVGDVVDHHNYPLLGSKAMAKPWQSHS